MVFNFRAIKVVSVSINIVKVNPVKLPLPNMPLNFPFIIMMYSTLTCTEFNLVTIAIRFLRKHFSSCFIENMLKLLQNYSLFHQDEITSANISNDDISCSFDNPLVSPVTPIGVISLSVMLQVTFISPIPSSPQLLLTQLFPSPLPYMYPKVCYTLTITTTWSAQNVKIPW